MSDVTDDTSQNSGSPERSQVVSDGETPESLICLTCKDSIENTKMCASCERTCCKDCSNKLNTTRGNDHTENVNDNSIKIICPHNCGENLSDETYYHHLSNCKNAIRTLQCKNCNKHIESQESTPKGVNDHLGVCKKNCKLCDSNFYLMNYYHPKSKCPERLIKMFEMSLQSMRENQKLEDAKTLVECM